MKQTLIIALVLFVAVASTASAQVTGTKHDLSTNITGGQICVFCHTPHGANDNATLLNMAPLWNQTLNTAVNNYGSYSSQTFNGTDIVDVDRATYSTTLLCLSCHDGTVAPGSFYNTPNPEPNAAGLSAITGSANVGLLINNDHPVNFTYQASLDNGDTGLHPVAAVDDNGLGYLDTAGKVQCSSCHDPHDQGATKDTNVNFMNNTLTGSTLCLDCHIK